jgi:hypothetical protein
MPTTIEILTLRYYLLKSEGNPSINAILLELGLSYLNSGRILDDTSTLGGTSILVVIRTKADIIKGKADDIIK